MFKVVYMGFSAAMVKALAASPDFELQFAAAESSRQSEEYLAACRAVGCRVCTAENDRELLKTIDELGCPVDCVITHKTTAILHQPILDRYPCFNFHSGNLVTNKGAHPIAWSILLDERETELSLHKMNAKIDEGILIDSYKVAIGPEDSPAEVREALDQGIPGLLRSLCAFLQGKRQGTVIGKGIYRRKVKEYDFTIRETDTPRQVICKINSQKQFRGAVLVVKDIKYYVDAWLPAFEEPGEGKWLPWGNMLLRVKQEIPIGKKILLLGGSPQQVVAIETAKKMGYYTVLCDYLPDNPGQYSADRFYLTSTTDKEAVLEVARKEKVSGVLAYASDPAAPTAAYVARELGLPGNPYDSVEILCNKDRFRAFLRDHGFATPRAVGYTDPAEAVARIPGEGFHLPVILKPVDSSGSKGATVLRSWEGLSQAVEFAFSFSRGNRIIAEEFIEKKHPYLIGGDLFVENGKIILWGLMNCHRDERVNPLVPVGKSYPLMLGTEDQKKVHEVLQKLVTDLKIRSGAMNVELVVDSADRVFLIDVGPRNGGNMIPDLLGMIFGVNVVEMSVAAAMGREEKTAVPEGIPFYATHNLHSDRDGIYAGIRFHEELKPYIRKKCLYKKAGDPVEYFDNAAKALGILFLKFPDEKTMADILGRIQDLIEIQFQNERETQGVSCK